MLILDNTANPLEQIDAPFDCPAISPYSPALSGVNALPAWSPALYIAHTQEPGLQDVGKKRSEIIKQEKQSLKLFCISRI